MNKSDSYINYNIDLEDFQFCTRKKCPLRKSCLRKVESSFNYPYLITGGKYDKITNTCAMFINKKNSRK